MMLMQLSAATKTAPSNCGLQIVDKKVPYASRKTLF
jgi:hypothetical protein